MASIALEHLSKVYSNGQAALRDVSLTIADGELLALVGPSGSGKSTVLRLVAGLDAPSSGRILIDGEDVTAVPPQRRDLAMVFQSYALYPHKSVRDNLAFGLKMRGADPADIRARVEKVAAVLDIAALLDRKPAQLSGGQRQRVALGRAIVREPNAFLLDEPLSNLDPLLRVDMRTELALLHRSLAATMVYVTHDQEEAMTLGTRVGVLRDGRLEQLGLPLDLFERPASVFVATFFGSPAMNVWPCQRMQTPSGTRLVCPGLSLELEPVGAAASEGDGLVLGARPHDLSLVAPREADGVGHVEVLEPLGATTVVHVRLEGQSERAARIVVSGRATAALGDEVGIRIRRDRVHLFDERTGLAVRPS